MTIAQSLGGIFGALLYVPFRSKFYKDSSKDSANKIMTRELYQHSGRVFMLLVVFGFMLFLPVITAFMIGLIITGIITFGFSVLVSEDGELELSHIGIGKKK
jgi:glycerol uptake facilitator-like aquaporin